MTSYVTPFTGQSGAGYTQNKPLVDTFNGDDELSRLLGVTNSSLLVLSVSIGPTANNVTWVTWLTCTIPSLKNETQLHDYNPVPVACKFMYDETGYLQDVDTYETQNSANFIS